MGSASFLRPVFPVVLSYNETRDEGGRRSDDRLCGQRLCAEHLDGLFAGALHRAAGGCPAAPRALCAGGSAGRSLRRGGVSAGVRLFGPPAGKGRGGRDSFPDRLRRRSASAAADAAALCCVLRHGWVRAGAGPSGGRRCPGGPGRFLYRCLRQGTADRRGGGLPGTDGGVSGGGPPRPGRRAGGYPGVRKRQDRGPDSAAGYRQRSAGPGDRGGGAGGVSGSSGWRPAAPGGTFADAGAAAVPAGSAGTPGAGGAGAAVASGALSGGGRAGRAAAGGAQRLDRDLGGAASGAAGGVFPHGPGAGICRSVGRSGQKERQA